MSGKNFELPSNINIFMAIPTNQGKYVTLVPYSNSTKYSGRTRWVSNTCQVDLRRLQSQSSVIPTVLLLFALVGQIACRLVW